MKSLRVLSLLAIFILLATSTMPVMAKGKGPEIGRVETFEVVRNISGHEYSSLHPAASMEAMAAAACKSYTLGRKGYTTSGEHIWTYSWTIDWCYNGSTITSYQKYSTVWGAWGWHYRGSQETQSGGVGQTSYTHYGMGTLCYIDVGVCIVYAYPWVNQTVRGNGTYSGNAGGS